MPVFANDKYSIRYEAQKAFSEYLHAIAGGLTARPREELLQLIIRGNDPKMAADLLLYNRWSVGRVPGDEEKLLSMIENADDERLARDLLRELNALTPAREAILFHNSIVRAIKTKDAEKAFNIVKEDSVWKTIASDLQERIYEVIGTASTEKVIENIIVSGIALPHSTVIQLCETTAKEGFHRAAFTILERTKGLPAQHTRKLIHVILGTDDRDLVVSFLRNPRLRGLSSDPERKAFDVLLRSIQQAHDSAAAYRVLMDIPKIPNNIAQRLRMTAGMLKDTKPYVWLINHGFVRRGIIGLLTSVEAVKDDGTLLLSPVWSEQADTYIYKKSAGCVTYTAHELQGLLREFWSASSLGSEIPIEEKYAGIVRHGIPEISVIVFALRGKKEKSSYQKEIVILRIQQDLFRVSPSFRRTINVSPYPVIENHCDTLAGLIGMTFQ